MKGPRTTSTWQFQRAENIDANPTTLNQRAGSFATAASHLTHTSLFVTRTENGVTGYFVADGPEADSQRAATFLAQAVGARAVPTEVPTDFAEDKVIGWLTFESGSAVARETQVGADVAETSRLLANALPRGAWVGVSMRKPSKTERSRWTRWLSHRLSTAVPTHHSMGTDATLITVFAGAEDSHGVRSLLEATRSAMPGFDVSTRSRVATRMSAAAGQVAAAVLLGVLGLTTALVPQVADIVGNRLFPFSSAAAVLLGLGALKYAGVLPSAWKRTQAAARAGVLPSPPKRLLPPTRPRDARNGGPKPVEAREGSYPLSDATFMVGPQVVVGIVAPQAGAVSGETATRVRDVPPAMLRRIGPLLGDTDSGPAYLSAADAFGGCAIVGKAGSGKTQLVRSLFGWSCLDRTQPCGLPGFPGARNALIAFESKGDGVVQYQSWVKATGDVMLVIDIANPETHAIDLFAVPGSPNDRANFFVNALKYAFGDQAIGDRSFETLLGVLPAALMVTPDIAGRLPEVNPNGSVLYFAHVLLGGRGDDVGKALANELSADSQRSDAHPDLREAVIGMGPLYGANVTPAQRRALAEAPRNKIRQLVELESWWTPLRSKVTWNQIIENHRIVVINTGTSMNGKIVEDELNQQMSAILMFSLRHAIMRLCSGWESQGRSVSIFADELSLLAGSSETVISWLKDQGRSFGVRPFLATQRPEQLPDKVRSSFMNFSTLISFMQEDMKTAREIAEGVSGEEGEWSAADVLQLNTYTAVVRPHVEKKRQPAFTVRVRNFEADRVRFASEQGYIAGSAVVDPYSMPMAKAPVQQSGAPAAHPAPAPVEQAPIEAPIMADPLPTPPPAPAPMPVDDDPVDDLMSW